MGELRERIPDKIGDQRLRKAFYQQVLALLIETDNQATQEDIEDLIRDYGK
jgi:hypothetical protein